MRWMPSEVGVIFANDTSLHSGIRLAQTQAAISALHDMSAGTEQLSASIDVCLSRELDLQGLNSRLVPVTTNATLAALSALYFSTVPAGGGFIATPVNASGEPPSPIMLVSWRC